MAFTGFKGPKYINKKINSNKGPEVKLAPGTLFAMDGRTDPGAVRISLSHEPDRERVRHGLMVLSTLLQTKGPQDSLII